MLLALARSLEITFVVLNSMADIYGDLPPPVSEHGARKAHADGGASNVRCWLSTSTSEKCAKHF